MGDHFVLLADRLLTESTLAAALESRSPSSFPSPPAGSPPAALSHPNGKVAAAGKLVECRICQEEDEQSNMETPCSCCGSLKYAHRKCIQRWCNEKGNTICEICLQQLKPGYTAPLLFHYGSIPMNFRGNWEVSRRDVLDRHYMAMIAADRDLERADPDVYSVSSTRGMMVCRLAAITFMVLLVFRQTLPLIQSGAESYSLGISLLVLLRTSGIVLPLYIILRTAGAFHWRRNQQETQEPSMQVTQQPPPMPPIPPHSHLICVR